MVVDATNPLNATFNGLAIDGISGAEAVQQAAGSAPVVKAFNTVFASRYAAPAEEGTPLTVLVAGDDAAAKSTVAELADVARLRSLDAGSLRIRPHASRSSPSSTSRLNAGNGWAWQNHFQARRPRPPDRLPELPRRTP